MSEQAKVPEAPKKVGDEKDRETKLASLVEARDGINAQIAELQARKAEHDQAIAESILPPKQADLASCVRGFQSDVMRLNDERSKLDPDKQATARKKAIQKLTVM